MCIRAPRSSAASIIRISPSTRRRPPSAAALEGLQPPNDISWQARPTIAHADYLAWTEKATPQPGAVNLGEIVVWLRENLPPDAIITNGAGNFSAWVHRFYRFRKFATQFGADLRLHGLWLAGGGGDEALASRAHGGVLRRRRRLPDERAGVRHRRAIRPADHRRDRRQRHLRHHPHAPGARISRPRGRHRAEESGFRRLCAGLRRLRRDGGEDRRFRRGLRGGAEIRQARDHPSQGRSGSDHADHDARRHPRKGARRRRR